MLRGVIFDRRVAVEVLPERASVTAPSLTVWCERHVNICTAPRCIESVISGANIPIRDYYPQFDVNALLSVGGRSRTLLEELIDSICATEDNDDCPKTRK